jgi:hypothetical protein
VAPCSALHAPAPYGGAFKRAKQAEFDNEADQDHRNQSGEYLVGEQLVAVAEG